MTGQSIKILLKQYIKKLVPSRSIGLQTILIKKVSNFNSKILLSWYLRCELQRIGQLVI